MPAKILVVEDDPGVRKAVTRMLAASGYDVSSAESGEEAVGRVDDAFDVVVTDLKLPGAIDGNEVTRRFRVSGMTDVIIMTAFPQLETSIRALRDGAYDYLVKPVSEDFLRAVVERCLERRRLSEDLAREKALRSELHRAYFELAELTRVREIFGQFATPEVAKVVMRNPEDFWTRGEKRKVTVLFADIRNFTAYSASVPPEQTTAAVNAVFSILQDAVHRAGGILNKFLGDGAMALFGAPIPLQNHEAAAIRAALSIQREMGVLAKKRAATGLRPLNLGIGINTGDVIAGCLGTKERTEYSVIGSPINLAARFEKAAEPGQVLLGPQTAAAVRADFELKDLGAREFHGLPGSVPVFAVLSERKATAARG